MINEMGLNELSNQSDISLHNMRFGLIRSPGGSVLFWEFKPWVGNWATHILYYFSLDATRLVMVVEYDYCYETGKALAGYQLFLSGLWSILTRS